MATAGVPPLRAALFWGLLFPLISAREGVLHAYNKDNPLISKDYCIMYNPSWTTLPTTLNSATPLPLLVLDPRELCSASDDPYNNMNKKAIIVKRGNCTFLEKAHIAQNGGAKALLISSTTGLVPPSLDKTINIPVALMSLEDVLDIKTLGYDINVALYSQPLPMFDFSMVVIFLIAVITVAVGGFWSGMEELEKMQAGADPEDTELARKISETVIFGTWKVILFVVLSSVMLILLYFFYKYLVYVVIGIFGLSSAISLYVCLDALMSKIPFGKCRIVCRNSYCEVRQIFLAGFCIALAVVWLLYRNEDSWAWILQDILGIAFCLYFIKTIKVPNFKCCVILLGLLLWYDVFFVFITPYLTKSGESVMVEVAKGPATTNEKLPVVMKVPRLQYCMAMICGIPFSLLGFGDIILPGLLVAYCHRFDVRTSSSSQYYISCTIAYAVGMLLTFLVLSVMKMAQPALLYLVPCTLITSALVAYDRREMRAFWEGNPYQESHSHPGSDTEEQSAKQESHSHPGSDTEQSAQPATAEQPAQPTTAEQPAQPATAV